MNVLNCKTCSLRLEASMKVLSLQFSLSRCYEVSGAYDEKDPISRNRTRIFELNYPLAFPRVCIYVNLKGLNRTNSDLPL
jgi:hypothetical protein